MTPPPPSSSDMTPASAAGVADRRLSVAELYVFVIVLVCAVIFAVLSVQDRLAQTRTDRLHSAAQAVAGWVSAAHQARRTGVRLEPDRCGIARHQPLSYCFSDMVSPGQPFAGLKNTIQSEPAAPSFAFISDARAVPQAELCTSLPDKVYLSAAQGLSRQSPENWAGVIVVQIASFVDDLSVPVNRLNIGYCDSAQTLVWIRQSVAF